ncbi:DUF3899 domain-containing protein [Mesobacillus selenatarsenatis]|uniref:DUF3899 domain-containing protein n=1 Tax=Mesobacillus selenatarsenatis (strain DSM 18680 / JCM 14380 / FERM P-15431 / SF-1) TaxID=1321606 RepID=A0A0A8XC19_MESS1|nr:DUF3899 domain-containing protein [Mesobacillus selenatarsenatis]GAM16572.1 hypothetical protein SAMD00020551_4801 [Mesobacillus selenatarsenatis SF-1]
MRNRFGKIFYGFLISQLLIFILSLVYQQSISLLSYINISFYIASTLLFTSLIVFTVNSGFFDAISYSFRIVFAGKEEGEKKKSLHEMTPLSELVTLNANPLLMVGLLDFMLMLAALSVYYL